ADNITMDSTPTFTGKAVAGSRVSLYDDTTLIGSGTANGSGIWTITSRTLADGPHAIRTKSSDKAGNFSAYSVTLPVTIDTVAPSVPGTPDLAAVSDSGALNSDNVTKVTAPTFNGTADAGVTVVLYDNNTVIGTGKAKASGQWVITPHVLAD